LDGWQDVLREGKFFRFNGSVHWVPQCVLNFASHIRRTSNIITESQPSKAEEHLL
jgi:hypothetical protein